MADPGDIVPYDLSGCANGGPLLVTATSAGAAQTLDTAVTGTTDRDYYHVWACNTHTADVDVTFLLGGTTEPDNIICGPFTLTAKSGVNVVLDGEFANNAKVLRVYASVGSEVTVTGYKNRRTGGD